MPYADLLRVASTVRGILNHKVAVRMLETFSQAYLQTEGLAGKEYDTGASHARSVTALNAENEIVDLLRADDEQIAGCLRQRVKIGRTAETVPWDRRPPAGTEGDSINLRNCTAFLLPFTDTISMGTFLYCAGMGISKRFGPMAGSGQLTVNDYSFTLGISAAAAEAVGGPEVNWSKLSSGDPFHDPNAMMACGAAICAEMKVGSTISSALYTADNKLTMGKVLFKGAFGALRRPEFRLPATPEPVLASPQAATFDASDYLDAFGLGDMAKQLRFINSDGDSADDSDDEHMNQPPQVGACGHSPGGGEAGQGQMSNGATAPSGGEAGQGQMSNGSTAPGGGETGLGQMSNGSTAPGGGEAGQSQTSNGATAPAGGGAGQGQMSIGATAPGGEAGQGQKSNGATAPGGGEAGQSQMSGGGTVPSGSEAGQPAANNGTAAAGSSKAGNPGPAAGRPNKPKGGKHKGRMTDTDEINGTAPGATPNMGTGNMELDGDPTDTSGTRRPREMDGSGVQPVPKRNK